MLYKIIEILFPVFIIVLIGIFYAKRVKIDIDSINKINLDIFIPFLIFYSISSKLPNISVLGYFSLGAVIIVFGSGLILYPFIKLMKIDINSLKEIRVSEVTKREINLFITNYYQNYTGLYLKSKNNLNKLIM